MEPPSGLVAADRRGVVGGLLNARGGRVDGAIVSDVRIGVDSCRAERVRPAAAAATLGGVALAESLRPALGPLRWLSVAVLAGLAARAIWSGARHRQRGLAARPARALSPARAYATLAGLTLVNPSTLIPFVALVVGLRAASAPSALDQTIFVAAAFAASASWQVLLACGGVLLGRVLTGVRGQGVTAWTSGILIAALAARLAFG